MRQIPTHIWDLWNAGGPFLGSDGAPDSRVTVEEDWGLHLSSGATIGTFNRGPIRWWQREDNSQVETELPNIKRVSIDRSVDTPAGTCTVVIDNQKMDLDTAADDGALGNPGYYTFSRGESPDETALWGHEINDWHNVLTPNALLRTYQGYGGKDKSLADALADGNLVLTGVWCIDDVRIDARAGTIDLVCRDLMKLCIEQYVFPPLIPENQYPQTWCTKIQTDLITPHGGGTHAASSEHSGHPKEDSFENNPATFWLSGGSSDPNPVEWIEFISDGGTIDKIVVRPIGGNYLCYVSVMVGGVWQGSNSAPNYPNASTGGPPYVASGAIKWEQNTAIPLGNNYNATRVRLTFTSPMTLFDGLKYFGVREFETEQTVHKGGPLVDGPLDDYVDIIKDLLLYAGFWLYPGSETADPIVYGNIESTGIPDLDGGFCVDEDKLDKRPIIDVINEFKEIVGYLFWVDEEGAVHFESPNWWEIGNFYEDGTHTTFIPTIDERTQLTAYSMTATDRSLRSEMIVSSDTPYIDGYQSTIFVRYRPPTFNEMLRGQERPFMWVNQHFTSLAEAQIMAELVAMHIFFQQRTGSLTMVANPAIQINDQVRLQERQSSDTFVHYVRGVTSEYDAAAGTYMMTLTTHWLGEGDDWVITAETVTDATFAKPRFTISGGLSAWLADAAARSRAINVSRLS